VLCPAERKLIAVAIVGSLAVATKELLGKEERSAG
jgi:hypothetical protein